LSFIVEITEFELAMIDASRFAVGKQHNRFWVKNVWGFIPPDV